MVSFSTRAASGLAALGLAAGASFLVASPAQALDDPTACGYAVASQTDTVVTTSPATVNVGDVFTATATVTSDGKVVTGGQVQFTYGDKQKVGTIQGGSASVEFTADDSGEGITADYLGLCVLDQVAFAPSQGAQILGVEALAPPKSNGNPPTIGGLADTGLNPATQLVALTGAGLLTAGAATLVIRRRRVTI